MRRISALCLLTVSLGACFELGDDEFQEAPYDIEVTWTMAEPPAEGTGYATISYGDDSLEVIGYTGLVHAAGLAPYGSDEVKICVALARRYTQIIDGREANFYEPLANKCEYPRVLTPRVSFSF